MRKAFSSDEFGGIDSQEVLDLALTDLTKKNKNSGGVLSGRLRLIPNTWV